MLLSTSILIPIYKTFPTKLEEISIRQTLRVFRNAEIYFICPNSLSCSEYSMILNEEGIKPNFSRFDDSYFSSISSYNGLLLSKSFYQRFISYEYLLIIQTDAFVFRDELEKWVQYGYDYVGAPWFEGLTTPSSQRMIGVGNGGFSLRKVKSFIDILDSWRFSIQPLYSLLDLCRQYMELENSQAHKLSIKKQFTYILKSLIRSSGYNNNLEFYKSNFSINEDLFISNFFPCIFPDFRIPDPDLAKFFAFEINPAYLFHSCNQQLPFGCHGWYKYEPDFWWPIVSRLGYQLPELHQ
jgi:hypothetical protein